MSSAQNRFVLWATLLADSAWLYAVFALVGLALGREGSPLGWLAVLAILCFSFLVARGLQFIVMPSVVAYAIQMLAGVIVLYLTLGTQVNAGGHGLDMGWIGRLSSETATKGAPVTAALGGFLGVVLWWRAGRLASNDYPVDNLASSFRLGIIALAMAAVVDIFHTANLGIYPLMFLFFASGLAGLSIGHILPASRRAVEASTWPRAIGAVVSGVLATGLIFSLLQRNVLSALSTPALAALNALKTAIFYVLIVPVGWLSEWIIRGLTYLIDLVATDDPQRLETTSEGVLSDLRSFRESAGEGSGLLAQVVVWTIVAIVVLIVLYFLARAFRRRVRWRRVQAEGMRESVSEDADPAYDMTQLLFNLIPQRFRRVKRSRPFNLPDDEAGVVDVFRIYFGLLVLAEQRGFPRPPAETPSEYERTLERVFPGDLVRVITAAFNRACYGHHPAPRDKVEEMRASLERLVAEAT